MAEVLTANPGGESPVGILRRKPRDRKTDPDLVIQHKAADARLRTAEVRRDTERRKLREEQQTLVTPIREDRQSNHFADMIRATMRQRGQA